MSQTPLNTEEKHPFARKTIATVNRVITIAEAVVFLLLLAFGLYAIWDNKQIDSENTAARYEMYKPTATDTRGYHDFKKLNPDVCGWLTIGGTGIDYPLVQGKDNDEYMNKTPDLKFALSGSLFLDAANRCDFSDFNTIIYGHHMEGPSMFGGLDLFQKKRFFKKHPNGLIYYGKHWHKLKIFAYLEVDAYDQSIYGIVRSDAAARQAYLDTVKAKAKHVRRIHVTPDDHLVVMSTCMNDATNARYIVVARIGRVTKGPARQHTGRSAARDGLSPGMINLLFALLAAGIIAVLVTLYLWTRKKKRLDAAESEGAHRDENDKIIVQK